MLKRSIIAMGIFSLLSACAVPHTRVETNRYRNHELDIAWESVKTDTGVRLAGSVTNVRPDLPYNSLQLTAKLMDENRNVLGQGSTTFPSRFVGSAPFTMEIPLAQNKDFRRVNFSYSYGTVDDFFRREFEIAQ